jgi:hypothetical protein
LAETANDAQREVAPASNRRPRPTDG